MVIKACLLHASKYLRVITASGSNSCLDYNFIVASIDDCVEHHPWFNYELAIQPFDLSILLKGVPMSLVVAETVDIMLLSILQH